MDLRQDLSTALVPAKRARQAEPHLQHELAELSACTGHLECHRRGLKRTGSLRKQQLL